MIVGKIAEIWRYPVKSMSGEMLQEARIGRLGIAGDRYWAVRDNGARGEIRTARKFPVLLRCAARCLEEVEDEVSVEIDWSRRSGPLRIARRAPAVEVVLPDDSRLRSDATELADRLAELIGIPVRLCPLEPPDNREHYVRFARTKDEMEDEFYRKIMGIRADEERPDLTRDFGADVYDFVTPTGTYFDALPLQLLTTASLAKLKQMNPEADFDRRRFRPNLLVEIQDGEVGFREWDWCGRRLFVGDTVLKVGIPIIRCVMPTLAQAELPKDPSVLRTVVEHAGRNMGVYLTIDRPGRVRVGDPLVLE